MSSVTFANQQLLLYYSFDTLIHNSRFRFSHIWQMCVNRSVMHLRMLGLYCLYICSRLSCVIMTDWFVTCGVGLLCFCALLFVLLRHSPVYLSVCLSVWLSDCLFVYLLYGPCCLIQINEWNEMNYGRKQRHTRSSAIAEIAMVGGH